MSQITPVEPACMINIGKEHSVKPKHAEALNKYNIGLLIIVDSSSSELETIKQFNCDVLVVDHHEVDHKEYIGITNDGKHRFVIVNNTLDNLDTNDINCWIKKNNPDTSVNIKPYIADDRMSCGLVIYELLRIYQEAFKLGELLESMLLYQWSGVTLLTDAIPLLTDRNQWYIDNTVHSNDVEPTLYTIMRALNKYIYKLDKSFISYTLAPTFNKAIRANQNALVLDIVMKRPYDVEVLKQFREVQDTTIEKALELVVEKENYCLVDLTNTGLHNNYTGVIAGTVCDTYNKNTIVYSVENGLAIGSFRGRMTGSDYRKVFQDFDKYVYAQGHKGAFGFKIKVEDIDTIMNSLINAENSDISNKPYLTAGDFPEVLKGEYHIDDFDTFRKQGGLLMLGMGNSKTSSDEQIMLTVPSHYANLIETRGKLFIYNVLNMECKAFEEINKENPSINIYAEFNKSLEFFIK